MASWREENTDEEGRAKQFMAFLLDIPQNLWSIFIILAIVAFVYVFIKNTDEMWKQTIARVKSSVDSM